MIKNVFINPTENRLRTGWRILIFLIIIVAIAKLLSFLIKLIGGPPDDNTISEAFKGVFLILVGTSAVWISRKYFDKKSFTSFGLNFSKRNMFDLFGGFILSGFMIGLLFLLLLLFGYLDVENIGYNSDVLSTFSTVLLLFFGIGLAVGWWEELVFRGYLLQNLKEGIGIKWAVILSSLFFGVLHILNPNGTILSSILITLITFLLVFGWLRTGQLWIPIGIHAGWNFFMGPIFGFPVSGNIAESYVKHAITGPDWITGGDFGPEGGIIVLPVVLIGFIALFFWTKKRKNTPLIQHKLHN